MLDAPPKSLHGKITELRLERGLSERQLAAKIGIKASTLNSSLTNKRKLNFELVDNLASALGVDLSYFSRFASQIGIEAQESTDLDERAFQLLDRTLQRITSQQARAGTPIGIQTFLDWWYENSGRLESFDQLAPYVDLFDKPESCSKLIKPKQTGPKSLASICFDVAAPDQLKRTLDGFTTHTNRKLVNAHLEALSKGEPVLSHPQLDEPLRDGSQFTRRYRRVLAPLTLKGGEQIIANFSQDLPLKKRNQEA